MNFFARTEQLAEMVGDGTLTARVTFDQVYAKYQSETLDLNHPQGGEAKFLSKAQQDIFRPYYQNLAGGALDDGGRGAAKEGVEKWMLLASAKAPIGPADGDNSSLAALHPGLLRASAHGEVFDGERKIHDAPGAPRQED